MSVMTDSMKGAALVRDVVELSVERDASNDTVSRASGLTGTLQGVLLKDPREGRTVQKALVIEQKEGAMCSALVSSVEIILMGTMGPPSALSWLPPWVKRRRMGPSMRIVGTRVRKKQ